MAQPQSSTPAPWWQNWSLEQIADIYGPIISGGQIQEAFYNTLDQWLPTYIKEANRQLGGDILAIPKRYKRRPEDQPMIRKPEAQILVIVNDTVGEPERHGDGTYRTTWEVEASAMVFGTSDWQETQALTHIYGACIRVAISQHPSLGDFAENTLWIGESYKLGELASNRYSGLAVSTFHVTLENTMDDRAGPPLPEWAAAGANYRPTLMPQGPLPTVLHTDVVVDKEEL